MIAAIDSYPLSDTIFNTYDYSGLQFHLLTNRPLSRILTSLSESELTPRLDGNSYRLQVPIPKNIFWSDGQPIRAADYLAGFNKVLQSNPFIRVFLLRHLVSATVAEESLSFEFSQLNFRIGEILRIPAFCPFRSEELSSGNWTRLPGEKSAFVSHLYNSRKNHVLWVKVVKDPVENLEMFSQARIDFSADTAFPFDRSPSFANDPQLQRKSAGLYSVVSFSKDLASLANSGLRYQIAEICRGTDLSSVTFGACPRSALFEIPQRTPILLSKWDRPLRLAFDPFYPNREICKKLSEKLRKAGFSVELVEDDYYKPSAVFDLKLTILRGLHDSPYLVYSSLLMGEVLRQNRTKQLEYGQLLARMEREENPSTVEIRQFIRDEALLSPLVEIPSLSLARDGLTNPLTEGLVL